MNKKYQFLHELLNTNEISTTKFAWKSAKKLGKNIRKDPISGALMISPIPGGAPAGAGLHLLRNKGSRKILKTTGSKLIHPNRLKAGERKTIELDTQKRKDLSKYLSISRAIA